MISVNNNYEINYWITRDGKKLRIKEMDTQHIENTINYLKRNMDFYDYGYYDPFDFSDNWYEDNSNLVDKKIQELEYELKRRRLNAKKRVHI